MKRGREREGVKERERKRGIYRIGVERRAGDLTLSLFLFLFLFLALTLTLTLTLT